jgi:hypothetical protein
MRAGRTGQCRLERQEEALRLLGGEGISVSVLAMLHGVTACAHICKQEDDKIKNKSVTCPTAQFCFDPRDVVIANSTEVSEALLLQPIVEYRTMVRGLRTEALHDRKHSM